MKIFIDAKKINFLTLEVGDYQGDLESAKRAIEAFTMDSTNTIETINSSSGYSAIIINGRTNAYTPNRISINQMLTWCGVDKDSLLPRENPFFMQKQINSTSMFSTPGILNFLAMHIQLEHTITYTDKIGEKVGGTDVGHLISYKDKTYIVKTGMSLSLLGQALKHIVENKIDRAYTKLSYIIDNYIRITNTKDKNFIEQSRLEIFSAFDNYLLTEHGQQLRKNVFKGHLINTDDVYQIYTNICAINANLQDLIGLPAFADVINGCYSQHINNIFQLTLNNTVAEHKLFLQPENQPGMFQGSHLLDGIPFDKILLNPFVEIIQSKTQTEEQWLTQCQEVLRKNLKTVSLNGLCTNILIRHIMGESADNGADNMISVSNGIVNIDLTGFRHIRKDTFADALGWADTLALNSVDELLENLFHSSVFQDRFVKNSNQLENLLGKDLHNRLTPLIYKAIIDELKARLRHTVVAEIAVLREWLANINPILVNNSLADATRQVYSKLNKQMKFSEHFLDTFIMYNQQFISLAHEVAKNCAATLQNSKYSGHTSQL